MNLNEINLLRPKNYLDLALELHLVIDIINFILLRLLQLRYNLLYLIEVK